MAATPQTGFLVFADLTGYTDGANVIVLDFSHLEYMNSGGIGLLVTLLVRAQREGQRLMAVGLSDHCRQILSLTRLEEAIASHATEAEALAVAGA